MPTPPDGPSDELATLRARLARAEALGRVQAMLAEADLDLDGFMQRVVDALEELTGADGVMLELVEGDQMVYRATTARHAAHLGLRIARAGSLSGLAVERREMLLCDDTKTDPRVDRAACAATGVRSMICAPLLARRSAVGTVKIASSRPSAFAEADVEALRLLAAILGAEIGKQISFESSERLLVQRTAATLALSLEVEERARLERSLRANEARLAGVIAHALQAIVTMDGQGVVTGWNRHAETIFGWTAAEATGRVLNDLIIPIDVRAEHQHIVDACLASGEGAFIGRRVETIAARRSGERFPIEFAISATRGVDSWDFTVLLHDISERRGRDELFENAFNHASIGMALVGLDGQFLKVNDAFCDIVGYTSDEARALDFQTITHPDDLDEDLGLLGQLLAGDVASYRMEKRYFRKGGAVVPVRLSVSLVEDTGGAPKHFIAQVQDLTGERAAEDRYRLMAQNATDIILTSDLRGLVTFISPACETVTGYPAEAIVGHRASAIVHADDVTAVDANFLALVAGLPPRRVRCRIVHRENGHVVWLESNAALLRDGPDGEITGVIDVIRDVTLQKEGEDALAAAQAAAEAAMRSKGDFLANMSHELRTPLNSIIGFSRLLGDDDGLAADSRRYVGLLNRAGQALGAVIENVLDYSKLDAAALSLDAQAFDLPAFFTETVHLMQPQSAAKDIRVHTAFAPDMPRFAVGDVGRLRQVMLNLLSNAVKFTAQGHVTVAVSVLGQVAETARLRVEIVDTGLGIAPHKLVRLFNRFVQAGPEVATRYGGTGLGLEITKRLIELMGGTVGVTSALGEGSTFWFEVALPIADAVIAAAPGHRAAMTFAGKRILVADDVDLNRDLMLAILTRYGVVVDLASDGGEAIALATASAYDLVLMDCQMPVADGFAATRAIRAAGAPFAATPIVALTASTQREHLARCRAAGMDGHLTKPIDPALLEATLARYLEQGAAPVTEPAPTAPPSLAERYAARKRDTLEAVATLVRRGSFTDAEVGEVAAMAHKLAGVAGMFGDGALGASMSDLEDGLTRWTRDERAAAIRGVYAAMRRSA